MRPVDEPGTPNDPSGRGNWTTRSGPGRPPYPSQSGAAGPSNGRPPGGQGPPAAPQASSDASRRGGPAEASPPGDPDGGPSSTSDLAGADGFASRPPRAPRDSTRPSRSGPGAGRHRRDGVAEGADEPEGDDAAAATSATGPGHRSRRAGATAEDGTATTGRKKKRKGSFWRELPLLIVVALVLTFVIQTFLGRIYVIPSGSMERTLHGCTGCVNDRVAVDKLSFRFSDPSPGDVVVFRGPPTWASNVEDSEEQSSNALVRGFQQALSLIGLAPPDERDFVKRVIAVGGQTVACCDNQNRVTVDGRPLNEPYIYYQPLLGTGQATFDPITVPPGQLWVMGDNRNNSSDARAHGPIGVTDVIGKAQAIVLPVNRWGGVPDTDPQAQPSALGAPFWSTALAPTAGLLLAVPTLRGSRRLRARLGTATSTSAPPRPGSDPPDDPADPPDDRGPDPSRAGDPETP